jgi:thiol-disulfide isomerase/thioredoxin
MKRTFIALFLSFFVSRSIGQQLNELRIGDTLPKLSIKYLSGDTTKSIALHELYKDSHLIIDFWATWCAACVRAIRDTDSISKKVNGKLTILPVTYEDSNTVRKFVSKNKILKEVDLKYIVNDSILMGGHFKFLTLPHEVWVDTQGIVRAITYPDQITYENIIRFINNESLSIPEKKENVAFNIMEKNLPAEDSEYLYRSILTPYKPELNHMIGSLTPLYKKDGTVDRFFAINTYILRLFYAAYCKNEASRMDYNRIELHVKDSFALFPAFETESISRELAKQHSFCYELILPNKASSSTFYNYALQDLNRFFPYQASIEKRKKRCWVLVNRNKNKNPSTQGAKQKLIWEQGLIKKITNQTMDVLVSYLNWNMDTLPVVDESSFKRPFDMDINIILDPGTGYFNIIEIRKSLQRFGFDLIKTERPIDVLIIRDK